MKDPDARSSAFKSVAYLVAAAFLLLGARALIDPAGGAETLGSPAADPRDLPLMQTTGARNFGMALLGFALIALGAWRSFGLLLAAAAVIAALDFWILSLAQGPLDAAKHAAYAAAFAVYAVVVLRGVSRRAA